MSRKRVNGNPDGLDGAFKCPPPLSRSPLLVFLLLGIGVLAFEHWLNGGNAEQRVVTVTAEQVDALRARWDAQWGRPPAEPELQGLIDEAIREEILYREALRLSLDRGDPIVRRRLAQKMTFMLEDNAELPAPAAHEVEAYFAAHTERYRDPDRTTFRHVYLKRPTGGRTRGGTRRRCCARCAPAKRAAGDRPATRSCCCESTRTGPTGTSRTCSAWASRPRCAASRQGTGRDLSPPRTASTWSGYWIGGHRLTPALDDVRERVVRDLLETQRREQNRAALQALRERYDVRMAGSEPLGERP